MEELNCFDFFEDKAEQKRRYIILVIYDISENKERLKLVKLLQSYGKRVQKSCFECLLSEQQYLKLVKEINKYVCDLSKDSIRIYKINGNAAVISVGVSTDTEVEDVIII